MRFFALSAGIVAFLLTSCGSAQTQPPSPDESSAAGLTIPASHPRLWWTPERLAQARTWYRANAFTPRTNDYLGQAFAYLMTGDSRYSRSAIAFAMNQLLTDTGGTGSNGARWYGEIVILIYDWCWDQMTAAERQTLIERWNTYMETLRKKDWGGLTMPQNNYFWGYLRNEFEWGVATWGENPMAESFLNHALSVRLRQSFVPHSKQAGRGGVAHEGSQYGRYLLGYPVVPFVTSRLLGRDLLKEMEFFRDAVFYLIYTTTPTPTIGRSGNGRYEIFPANDDQFFREGGSAEGEEYGNFMLAATQAWPDSPIGEYARRWLVATGARISDFALSTDRGGFEREFSDLPLDYYAPGLQYMFGRTSWQTDTTTVHLQLGSPSASGHYHDDLGNWQIWRNGRWLSRETTGYADSLAGYANKGAEGTEKTIAHNTLLLNGKGLADGTRNGPPVVRALESRPHWFHALVDLSSTYRNDKVSPRRERDNPVVSRVEREFVFIRPLASLVILDRLESNSSIMPAAAVTKTFLAHFETNPSIEDANHVLAINGDQALRLTTLLPTRPDYRVVEEGGRVGQYRLEVETSGSAVSYFVHVLQSREKNGQSVEATLSETQQGFVLALHHPEYGYARVELGKAFGLSEGGAEFSQTSVPVAITPFLNRVQEITVTDSGPVWEKISEGVATSTRVSMRPAVRKLSSLRRRQR